MDATRFGHLPPAIAASCAPTELDQDTDTHIKGTAHDFSTLLLGGVCGIVGAFTTTDLAAFLRYMLDASTAPAQAGFGAEWTACSLTTHTSGLQPERGLFWHPAPGTSDDEDVWVHYVFTGTGMRLSLSKDQWAALLTNKLYYTRDRQPLTDIRNTSANSPSPSRGSETNADGLWNDLQPAWAHLGAVRSTMMAAVTGETDY